MHSVLIRSIFRRRRLDHRRSVLQNLTIRHLTLAYKLHKSHRFEEEIPRKPLIILHGLFGSKRNNATISQTLAQDLRRPIYAVDLRNHGDSPHSNTHNYNAMATDIEEFINVHNLQEPGLIGHSMGAKVAMTVALRSPALVGSLISVDNAPINATLKSEFFKYVQGLEEVEKAKVSKLVEADDILKPFEDALAIRQFLLANLVRQPGTKYLQFRIPISILAASLHNMGEFPFTDPAEGRFQGPTLFIRGTQSHYISDKMLPLIGQFFPRFELRSITSGHWVISENPKEFRNAVVNFLSKNEEIRPP